jgi:trimethylamine---corrinoid protein Co-methyltransferase
MRLSFLGPDGVLKIDRAARKILEQTGVIVPQKRMLDLFSKAGAKVDSNEGRIRIPSALVDECLGQAVKKFTIYGRDRSKSAAFGIGLRNYNSSAGQAHWISRDGNRRFAALPDVVTAAQIGDCLP